MQISSVLARIRKYGTHIDHVIQLSQVCSVEATKQFVEKLPASDKKISLYEVRLLPRLC
jgi:hypothetical protein